MRARLIVAFIAVALLAALAALAAAWLTSVIMPFFPFPGIIAPGPPSLGTLADCIIALISAERGLARHFRGDGWPRAQTRVPAGGFYGHYVHSPRPRR